MHSPFTEVNEKNNPGVTRDYFNYERPYINLQNRKNNKGIIIHRGKLDAKKIIQKRELNYKYSSRAPLKFIIEY